MDQPNLRLTVLSTPQLLARLSADLPGPHLFSTLLEPDPSLTRFIRSHPHLHNLFFFQTSGSEGHAKWVGLSRQAILTSASTVNQHLESTASDHWLICLPLHHVGGFSILARSQLSGASFFHDNEKWNPHRFTQLCHQHHITLTSLVPTQIFDLVQHQLEAPPHLRAIVVGGGSLALAIGQQAQALGWPVLQSYGMTETASQIATAPLAQLHQGFDPDSLEVLPHWQLHTDPTSKRLIIRGPALAKGYLTQHQNQPTSWQWQPLNDELHSRDFVNLWQHGSRQFLQMLGRESAFLKVKGELINLNHLQKIIDHLLPGAALCPLPDPRRETKITLAWPSSKYDNSQVETALAHYHQTTTPFERIHHHQPLPQIPTTDLGKLNLPALQSLLHKKS